ncbi:hypothetical protein EV424DRAFT_1545728 [Suillus variegatus]|nr:hypothetical protein EV424DRAFT_1545728 [Suillus variegatus]
MDKAKDARKDKLYNRFQNCFGSTKAGRQAKSDATDVFNAVLKSIVQSGSKPTRNLQETEAYSKLYYTSRIKSAVKEALENVKEPLTNGQRIALVKKETAALYEMESGAVKDEVRKYMDDKKTEKDKNKDEEMSWSKEDHERNLTRLAAIVNKFLKGLQDATGLSFTVLAGGPSPELNGLIDVWSFHIGRTKLGNDFSTAYPLFDDGVMVPFRDHLYRVYPEAAVLMQSVKNGSPNFGSIADHDTSHVPSSLLSSSLHPAWPSLMPSADDAPPQVETSQAYFSNGVSDEPSFWEFDKTIAQSAPSMSMGMFSNPPPNVPSDWEAPAFPSWTSQARVSLSPDSIGLTLPDNFLSSAGMEHDYAVLPSINTSHGQEQLPSIDMHEQILPSINGPHGQELPSINGPGPHGQVLPSIDGPPGQVELPSIDTSHGHVAHVENESCLRRTGRVHRPSTRNMVANAIGGNHDEHAHSAKRGRDEGNSTRKAKRTRA